MPGKRTIRRQIRRSDGRVQNYWVRPDANSAASLGEGRRNAVLGFIRARQAQHKASDDAKRLQDYASSTVAQRGTILPLGVYVDGRVRPTIPGLIMGPASAFRREATDPTPFTSRSTRDKAAAVERAFEVSAAVGTGGLVAPKPRGSLGVSGGALTEQPSLFANTVRQTVDNPYREAVFPGIYGNPKEIVAGAASRVAPESPNLKKVFGVTRADLAEINQHGTRYGTIQPYQFMKQAKTPRGSESVFNAMTPDNRQRLLDTLAEAGKIPGLRIGMDNWYTMDPAHARLVKLHGSKQGSALYARLNTLMGMASPGSEVQTEIARGLLANHLAHTGNFHEFVKWGGNEYAMRKIGKYGVADVPGHAYHSTSQAAPMQRYLDAGKVEMQSAKVPAYIAASGPPNARQAEIPIADAHFSRFLGLADTRKGPTDIVASASRAEVQHLAPWWAGIAGDAGITPVAAQARLWGAGSGVTGVTSPIGAPKIELLADHIAKRSFQRRIPIGEARDRILSGELYANPATAAVPAAIPGVIVVGPEQRAERRRKRRD